MNVSNGDYTGLIYEISVAVDRQFSPAQAERIKTAFSSIDWNTAYRLTVLITRNPAIPKNVYGYVLSIIDEEIERKKKEEFQRDEWKISDEDCATPEEFKLTMKCLGLICRFENSADLCKRFGEYLEGAFKKGFLLESLKKAEEFYTDQIQKGINVKKNIGVLS